VNAVYESLQAVIAQGGTTIVLVEQDLSRVLRISTRVACMLEGRIVLEGKAADLTRERITEAYFGLRRGEGGMRA
jgi:branched-chain amino acid transport system ATP-binding protein